MGFVLLLAVATTVVSACSVAPEAIRNVVEYQVRRAFPPLIVYPEGSTPAAGSLSGTVRDRAGRPIASAVALVSSVRGQAYHAATDEMGRFRLDGVPPGRYVPMAGAWGFQTTNGQAVQVQAGNQVVGVDFDLPARQAAPVEPQNLRIGAPEVASSQFPEPMVATRIPFTFTLDGVTIEGGQIYLPEGEGATRSLAGSSPEAPPTLMIVYPSRPLNWDAASVALTRDGNAVLAVGPDSDRGLDMEGHGRDFRAAFQLWHHGQLPPLQPPDGAWVLMSGSFGSLILFRALPDLPVMPPAMVDAGGVSDAFLGIQALYSAELRIPPPYDSAIAALGRPDRDPAFFFDFSPVFYAAHLPPTFIVHTTNDEVIPYQQAEAMAEALAEAGIPHELLLYTDTTHYLDAYNPTPGTELVYERVLDYVNKPRSP